VVPEGETTSGNWDKSQWSCSTIEGENGFPSASLCLLPLSNIGARFDLVLCRRILCSEGGVVRVQEWYVLGFAWLIGR